MGKPINKAAACHLAIGRLEKLLAAEDVPPGGHDCSNLLMSLYFPGFAGVVRAEGTRGDGYNLEPPPAPLPLQVSPLAMLLFLKRSSTAKGQVKGKKAVALWADCIRDSLQAKDKPADLLSAEALEALAIVQAEQPEPPPAEPVPVKTQRKRTGTDEIEVEIKRLPKSEAQIAQPA